MIKCSLRQTSTSQHFNRITIKRLDQKTIRTEQRTMKELTKKLLLNSAIMRQQS